MFYGKYYDMGNIMKYPNPMGNIMTYYLVGGLEHVYFP
jgi:hypothetical protein